MSEFQEIEQSRENAEEDAYAEWAEARRSKPCPACGMPLDDHELIVCTDCFYEEW